MCFGGCTVRRAARSERRQKKKKKVPPRVGSDRRSSKLAAERYTSQTRIMLFYEHRGVPTYVYLPTYEDHCPAANFPGNSRRLRCSCTLQHSGALKRHTYIRRHPDGTRDRGMVFFTQMRLKKKKDRVVSRKYVSWKDEAERKRCGGVIFCCFNKIVRGISKI